jgi:uncharacterized membrane protein
MEVIMPKIIFTFLVYYFALVAAVGCVIFLAVLFQLVMHVIKSRILKVLPDISSGIPETLSG